MQLKDIDRDTDTHKTGQEETKTAARSIWLEWRFFVERVKLGEPISVSAASFCSLGPAEARAEPLTLIS